MNEAMLAALAAQGWGLTFTPRPTWTQAKEDYKRCKANRIAARRRNRKWNRARRQRKARKASYR